MPNIKLKFVGYNNGNPSDSDYLFDHGETRLENNNRCVEVFLKIKDENQ